MKNKFHLIIQDIQGYINYRNRIYGYSLQFPSSILKKIKIIFSFFVSNTNGFRDLCFYRLGSSHITRFLKIFYRPTSNLYLNIREIANGGCMFHHAFSTYINADYIGYQCSFRNNTTVGMKIVNGMVCKPYLEDHVFVGPNVVIIGDVRIGHDSIIGAGSVVTKDVPPYSVVAGNPAKVIKNITNNP